SSADEILVKTFVPLGMPITIDSAVMETLDGKFRYHISNLSDEHINKVAMEIIFYRSYEQSETTYDRWEEDYNLHFGLCESCNLAPNSSDEFSQIMQRAIMPEARAILVVSEVESDHGLQSLGADSWRLEKAKIDYLNGEGYSIPDAKWSAVPEKSGISAPQPL